MEYKSIREIADEWGISKRRIQVLCSENRMEGTVGIGYSWAVLPNTAPSFLENKKELHNMSFKHIGMRRPYCGRPYRYALN